MLLSHVNHKIVYNIRDQNWCSPSKKNPRSAHVIDPTKISWQQKLIYRISLDRSCPHPGNVIFLIYGKVTGYLEDFTG